MRDERGPQPEPTEFIRVVGMPFGEALSMVSEGEISDAATVLGLLLAGGRWYTRGTKKTGEP